MLKLSNVIWTAYFFMNWKDLHTGLERNWRVSIDIISQDIYTFLDVLTFLRVT